MCNIYRVKQLKGVGNWGENWRVQRELPIHFPCGTHTLVHSYTRILAQSHTRNTHNYKRNKILFKRNS